MGWFSDLFKKKVVPKVPKPVELPETGPKVVETSETPWMDLAISKIGEKEIYGSKHNSWIVSLFKWTSYKTSKDETPWCAAFINWALGSCGYKRTNSAAAKSFDHYGEACELKYGAIVTLRHPGGGRHVTFCFDTQPGLDSFVSVGGNERNSCRKSNWNKSEIVATRWPVKL